MTTKTEQLIREGQAVVMNTYGRLPMALVKGEGSWVWDMEGNKYLDFVSGIAVNSLGHRHPAVIQAIEKQAEEILHTSNLYWIPKQIELAKLLVDHSFADKVFFCNSGAEANEAALKLARKYAKLHYGPEKYEIISLKNSFHGRTLATLTATGQTKYQAGYEPLPEGFSYALLNNIADITEKISSKTAAVILEPIQGEGGIIPAEPDFLQAVRKLCDDVGALLIFDEVQTGVGRTGKLFAHEWTGVKPDIMTLAKALGGGVPIGAMLAKDSVAEAFKPGDHASTFGGNPLAAAAGCAVLNVMLEEGFLEDVQKHAEYFKGELQKLADKYQTGEPVRGKGFLLGWPVAKRGPELVNGCREKGLLINFAGGKALRFVPPLNVSFAEIDEAVKILDEVFASVWNA